jgi:hypothetical protein
MKVRNILVLLVVVGALLLVPSQMAHAQGGDCFSVTHAPGTVRSVRWFLPPWKIFGVQVGGATGSIVAAGNFRGAGGGGYYKCDGGLTITHISAK